MRVPGARLGSRNQPMTQRPVDERCLDGFRVRIITSERRKKTISGRLVDWRFVHRQIYLTQSWIVPWLIS